MTKKQKKAKQNNKLVQPILTLSSNDKIFLASTRRDDAIFAYVLALVCYKKKDGLRSDVDINPTEEIYTFESATQADVFHNTVQQMIKMNEQWMPGLLEILETPIKRFNEKIR